MADVQKLQTLAGILDYPDPDNPSSGTTEQQYQEFVKNHHEVLSNIVDRTLWQPGTAYKVGQVITSPNMVANTVARVTKAGTTGSAEPIWTAAGNSLSDGTVTYSMMYQTVDYATQTEVSEGTNTTKIVTAAMLGRTIQTDLASEKAVGINTTDKTVSCGVTGILPVAHGGTGTDTLDKITAGAAKALTGDSSLWNYLHRKGANFAPPTANAALNALGMFMSYYTQWVLANQPTQYGQLVNLPADGGAESTQFWIEQYSGRLYHRGGNGSIVVNDTPFTRFLDTNDLSAMGVVAGNVSNANAWWVKLGGTIPLIIQGGYNKVQATVTFPIAFSNGALSVMATLARGDEEAAQTWSYTKANFYLYQRYSDRYAHWLAIGF